MMFVCVWVAVRFELFGVPFPQPLPLQKWVVAKMLLSKTSRHARAWRSGTLWQFRKYEQNNFTPKQKTRTSVVISEAPTSPAWSWTQRGFLRADLETADRPGFVFFWTRFHFCLCGEWIYCWVWLLLCSSTSFNLLFDKSWFLEH